MLAARRRSRCPERRAPPARFDENTTSSPSARTFGWMSFAVASLSSATAVAGPKREPFSRVAHEDLAGNGRRDRAAREVQVLLAAELAACTSTYDGPCSSSSLFGPAGAQRSRSGSAQARCAVAVREVDVALAAGARAAPRGSRRRGRSCRRASGRSRRPPSSPARRGSSALPTDADVARASGHPDVEAAPSAGPVRRDVQAQAVRRLDRAAVERRRVDLRAVAAHLVELLRRRPRERRAGQRQDEKRRRTRRRARRFLLSSCVLLSVDCARERRAARMQDARNRLDARLQLACNRLEAPSIAASKVVCYARDDRTSWSFRVLGPLEVRRRRARTLALGGAKQRAVLAVLLLRAGEVVSVERLVDEVWGDDPPPSAAHTLESYVSRLRQLFNGHGPRLVRRGAGYCARARRGARWTRVASSSCRSARRSPRRWTSTRMSSS